MSLPRHLPPRGNPTRAATASTEMSYAQRQQGRAALVALTPIAGQSLSEFTDVWIAAMREAGFDSREISATKSVLVRLVDLGAELPSAATAVANPVAAVAPTPVEKRRDPCEPVVIATALHPSDDIDPDYDSAIAPPEPVDPYDDDRDEDVKEPPHLSEPVPAAPVTPPAAASLPKVPDMREHLLAQRAFVGPQKPAPVPAVKVKIPRPDFGLK